MPKIQKKKGQYTITLPKTLVNAKGWAKGDILELSIIDGFGDALLLRRTFKAPR